jgi:hypothetical protein
MKRVNSHNPKKVPAGDKTKHKAATIKNKGLSIIFREPGKLDTATKKQFAKLASEFNRGEGKEVFGMARGYLGQIAKPSWSWDPQVGPFAEYTVASALRLYFEHLRSFAEKKNAGKGLTQHIDGIIKKLSHCLEPPIS